LVFLCPCGFRMSQKRPGKMQRPETVDIADVPKTFPDTKVKGSCAEASQLGESRTPINPKEGRPLLLDWTIFKGTKMKIFRFKPTVVKW